MSGLRDERRLSAEEVTATVPESWLPFTTTVEVPLLEAVFGQERAVRAIEVGLGMNAPGYNLYASGPDGFGKTTIVELFLRRRAQSAPAPADWVFVHNFDDPDRPVAMSLPSGQAHAFATRVRHAVESAQREIAAAFESDSYARLRQELADTMERVRGELLGALQEQARQIGFALSFGPSGISTAPLIDGKPATPEQFEAMTDREREEIMERGRGLEKAVQETFLIVRGREREGAAAVEQLDRETAQFAVDHLVDPLIQD
ncbi:MAG: AAA family ATPase, partial [Chloroflexi bacterium]|nr:AAA family ATPase [Chloroflexota bacterium]